MWMTLEMSTFGLSLEEGFEGQIPILPPKHHDTCSGWPESEGQIDTLYLYLLYVALQPLKDSRPLEEYGEIEQSKINRISEMKESLQFSKVILLSGAEVFCKVCFLGDYKGGKHP